MTHDLSPTPREQLLALIQDLAVVHGKVTLSSGRQLAVMVRFTFYFTQLIAMGWMALVVIL